MDLEKLVRECIDRSLHMSLATVVDNRPWVSEVHFVYDDNLNLYWRSTPNRRHSQEIATNPYVAGNVVKQVGPGEHCPGAVYFEGTAKVLDDAEQQKVILPEFIRRLGTKESAIADAATEAGNRFYKISIKRWALFGDFGEGIQKYELEWTAEK